MDRPSKPVTLEVCIDSLASGLIAAEHGAVRVEVNSALELGGLTASIGLIETVMQEVKPIGCSVIAMVRPRPGGFVYGRGELTVMQRDIEALIRAGVDGVALGVLEPSGIIDAEAMKRLIEPVLSAGREAVFHRAFDLTPSPYDALEKLFDLNITRLLTSGQAPNAAQGAALIQALIKQADGRVEVLPGSGITADNVASLVRETGCNQVHASLSRVVDDVSGMTPPAIEFASRPPKHPGYRQADPGKVAAVIRALQVIDNQDAD